MCAATLLLALSAGLPTDLPEPPDAAPVGASSLHAFVEGLAQALEGRARLEKVGGPIRLDVSFARGVDRSKAERSLVPRLRKRLRDGGLLSPAASAPLRCQLTLSEEGGLVWAVALLDGEGLVGPASIAVQHVVDRELEVALGASVKPAQSRFVLERLGPLPPGVLDVLLLDVDGDTADEVAVLSVDGVRFYRAAQGRLERLGEPARLPGSKRWPRVVTGWLATVGARTLWLQTTAGHAHTLDVQSLGYDVAPPDLVPLRGTGRPNALPFAGTLRIGSPVVGLPLRTSQGKLVTTAALPPRIRDLAQVAGGTDVWIYVDDAGGLFSQRGDAPPIPLAVERVGDRIALADLDGDGGTELLTTSASAPNEPDHVVLRRLDDDIEGSSVLFRSPLSGGSIVALAAGHLDYGDRLDAVLVEEAGAETLLWRLKHAP